MDAIFILFVALVIDVAFGEPVNRWHPIAWLGGVISAEGNLVLLRSMTKDYALAGLRLGYMVAQESIISTLR